MESICATSLLTIVIVPSLQFANKPLPSGGLDSTVVAALIGLGGVILGALISGIFVIYQVKKTARIEKQRQEEQFRYEKQRQEEQFQHEKELEQYRKLLEKQGKSEESDEQRQEAAQLAMLRARTREERVEAYRKALRVDPLLSCLQILGMTQPLAMTEIYVRLRLHQPTRSAFHLDTETVEAEKLQDPNLLLKLGRELLTQRMAAALTPEAALETYRRCVVVGDPGAGKSTLLKHLALLAGEQRLAKLPHLPVHIELGAFAVSPCRDLLEFAVTVWEERYNFPPQEAREYLQEKFQKGESLLLCDALDETVTGTSREEAEASYVRASQAILNLATRYPQVPIIVTARKAGYHQRPLISGFTELEVLDFRQEDIMQFIQSWFTHHSDERKQRNASDLIARLQRHPRIEALAANPLLLTLITLVYEDQLDLPDRRAELYKQCIDTLLTRWDASRGIRRLRAFKPEHKRRLLEELAWHFHLQGRRYFPEAELLGYIATFLPAMGLGSEQSSQILAEIAAENGLLKEQAHGWHGFLHLTIQEYFVAQYAADHQQLETLLARRGSPWWEEVILLYAGRLPDASGLLQRLLAESETSVDIHQTKLFSTDLLLAGRCLAASAVVRQDTLRQKITTRLFTLLQSTSYPLTCTHVAETLAEIDRAIIPQLVALLSNEQLDRNMRGRIANILGGLGEKAVVPQLVALLSNEQLDRWVRGDIALALGRLGERAVIPQLVALLSNEQLDMYVRGYIAYALGSLGEKAVVPQLVALLSNEQLDRNVRGRIALALGGLRERAVIPQLVALLSNEQLDTYVRGYIADALGGLGEKAVVPQLVALLSNEQLDKDVRGKIALALRILGEKAVVPQLMALLSNRQLATYVRGRIADTLEGLGERAVIPQLVALLSNEQFDAYVRGRIALALVELGERAVIPQLVALLSNEQLDKYVRGDIALALGELGERAVIPQLVALLSNEQLDKYRREKIGRKLPTLIEDEEQVSRLAAFLPASDIANIIHEALWTLSRRLGLRIFISDGLEGTQVTVVKMREAGATPRQ